MENQHITASEISEITKVPASTLRAWRNRNGLFPHHATGAGWTRYDMADALAISFVAHMIRFGFELQPVINLANRMRPEFEKVPGAGNVYFLVDEHLTEDGVLDFCRVNPDEFFSVAKGVGPIFLIVEMKVIWLSLVFGLQKVRAS